MYRSLSIIAATALAAACQTTGGTGPLITGGTAAAAQTFAPAGCDAAAADAGVSMHAICRGVDLVAGGATGRPSSRLRYAETDQFDLDLNASMAAGIDPVRVMVEGGAIPLADVQASARPHPNSKRIVFWLARIRDTGGQNVACAPPSGDRNFGAALASLGVNMAFDRLEAWRTYRPASDYNALLMVERDAAVGDMVVRRVEFRRRDSGEPLVCPTPEPPAAPSAPEAPSATPEAIEDGPAETGGDNGAGSDY